jgi:hypothetical protein
MSIVDRDTPDHLLFRSGTQQFASAPFSLAAWIKEQDNEGGSSAASSESMSHRRNEASESRALRQFFPRSDAG